MANLKIAKLKRGKKRSRVIYDIGQKEEQFEIKQKIKKEKNLNK